MLDLKIIHVNENHKVAYARVDYNIKNELFNYLDRNLFNLDELLLMTNEKRKIEWMSVRYLISKVHNTPDDIIYNEHRKPFFTRSKSHLSISHSHEMIAISIHESQVTGIDIQLISTKIERIVSKFLRPKEIEECGQDSVKLTFYWSIKEALFKIYGRKDAYLKENFNVVNADFKDKWIAEGHIKTDNLDASYNLALLRIQNYTLAYVLNS